ncbi:DUF3239 domain-containing protein [Corynebacterium sp. Marseille-Q2516]
MKPYHFRVDEAWAKQNNELLRDSRRLRIAALILAAIFLGAGIAARLILSSYAGSWLFFAGFAAVAIVFVIIACVTPNRAGQAQQLYDRYPLVPAIIAEVNARDVVLLALVDASVDPAGPPVPALALRTVTALKGHERKVGVQVPAAAVGGRRSSRAQTWDEIPPMPTAWGTPDTETIAAATAAIDRATWGKVKKLRSRLDDVKATPRNLLIL